MGEQPIVCRTQRPGAFRRAEQECCFKMSASLDRAVQNVPRQATTAAWAKYSVVSAAFPQFKFQLQLQALQVLQQISSVRPSPALSLLVPHVRRAFEYLSNQMYVRNVKTSVSDNTVHVK